MIGDGNGDLQIPHMVLPPSYQLVSQFITSSTSCLVRLKVRVDSLVPNDDDGGSTPRKSEGSEYLGRV